MDNTRLSAYAWDLLIDQVFSVHKSWMTPPEKFFLWNAKGIYIDYHYADTLHGHYIGGDNLLGKRITTVLPQPMAKGVRMSVFQTIDLQQPLIENYELTINRQCYRVQVRFLPFQNNVLGIVNDFPNQPDNPITINKQIKKRPIH